MTWHPSGRSATMRRWIVCCERREHCWLRSWLPGIGGGMAGAIRSEAKMVKQVAKTGCNVLLVQKSILRDAVTDLSLDFCAKAGNRPDPAQKR